MRRSKWMNGIGIAAALMLLLVAACGQRSTGTDEESDAAAEESEDGDGPCPGVSEGDRAKVVAQVGEAEITVCDVTEALNKMSPYLRKAYEAPQKRRQFVDNMIRFELIAQEAARRGYADDEEVQRVEKQMMIQRLNKELQESVRLGDIDDEQMRTYYEEHQSDYHKAEMVRIARILLESEPDCQKVLNLAKEKATDSRYFRQLARENSTDARTKEHGGDLPYFPRADERTDGDPEVEEAIIEVAFGLDMREPLHEQCVKTADGYNVVRLRGRRKARDLSFDDVKRQIRHRLHRDRLSKAREDLVTKLRDSADIVVHEEALSKVRIEVPSKTPGRPGPGSRPVSPTTVPHPGAAPAGGPAKAPPAKAPAKAPPAKAPAAG